MVSSLRSYQALGDTWSEERNKITGGGSFVSAPFPLGRYLKLAGQKCRSLRTDQFSTGHLRVLRRQLAAAVTPSDLGSLITRFMHDEDDKLGLNVRNGSGDQW